MDIMERCPECGAAWTGSKTCPDHFHQMGIWEFENPGFFPEVHHLMVLCYHLQHPSLYSPGGLDFAKGLLADFLTRDMTVGEVRRQYRARLDSGNRTFKVKGTGSSHGEYERPVTWTMTAADVTAGGVGGYCDNVRAWARWTLEDLRASGNGPSDGRRAPGEVKF